MKIRLATTTDLPEILNIYASARLFMAQSGNKTQWGDTYPPSSLLSSDIEKSALYVCEEDGEIVCVFYYAEENDPTYQTIYDGNWLNSRPYGVVHRIASSRKVKGAARFCINWAFEQCSNLKIDTHQDNIPMQNLLKNLGFLYTGIIHIENGDERIAFQKSV